MKEKAGESDFSNETGGIQPCGAVTNPKSYGILIWASACQTAKGISKAPRERLNQLSFRYECYLLLFV